MRRYRHIADIAIAISKARNRELQTAFILRLAYGAGGASAPGFVNAALRQEIKPQFPIT
jgi:hypothetical protein